MAQYFRDFSNDQDGPLPPDVIRTWNLNGNIDISGGALRFVQGRTDLGVFFTGFPPSLDSELFLRFALVGADVSDVRISLRSKDAGMYSRTGYEFNTTLGVGFVLFSRKIDGANTNLGSAQTGAYASNGEIIQVRCRVSSEDPVVLSVNVWEDFEEEPIGWVAQKIDNTPTSITDSGIPIIGMSGSINPVLVYSIGYGTDGDPAPTGPVIETRRRTPLLLAPF